MLSCRWLTRNVGQLSFVRTFATVKIVKKETKSGPAKSSSSAAPAKPKVDTEFKSLLQRAVDQQPAVNVAKESSADEFDARIQAAPTLNGLLNIVDSKLPHAAAKKILSKLASWMQANQIQTSEFVSDARFLTLCGLLSSDAETIVASLSKAKPQIQSKQLDTIMDIAGDRRAADICEILPIEQNLQVLASLAKEKSRSILVIRTIGQKIAEYAGNLNLKDCSGIFYAYATLNYDDEVVLAKTGEHVLRELQSNTDKMAVVGSIVTSLGKLRYRDADLLNALTGWIVERHQLFRPKDLVSLLMTLALLNFPSEHAATIRSTIVPRIKTADLPPNLWLNYVWSLSVLGLHESSHLASVLGGEFSASLARLSQTGNVVPAQAMKILNINAVAKHLTNEYEGPLLEAGSPLHELQFAYRKDKKVLVDGLIETATSLLGSRDQVRAAFDTGMGFVIDAECVLTKDHKPLPVANTHTDALRVAMMVADYNDYCRCDAVPNGITALSMRLLEKAGFKVLFVPHTKFRSSESILTRAKYLDEQLKAIIAEQN